MEYQCPQCGYSAEEMGTCPSCNVQLEDMGTLDDMEEEMSLDEE